MNAKSGKKWASANKGKRLASIRSRQLAKKMRTPKWADKEEINKIYIKAEAVSKHTGIPHEVDHIIPLQGKTVSGLHVHTNLLIITRSDNRSKGVKLCVS